MSGSFSQTHVSAQARSNGRGVVCGVCNVLSVVLVYARVYECGVVCTVYVYDLGHVQINETTVFIGI